MSKKLNLLPLLSLTVNRYQESVFEFQARRLVMAVIAKSKKGSGMSRWKLMRSASLPKERVRATCIYIRPRRCPYTGYSSA